MFVSLSFVTDTCPNCRRKHVPASSMGLNSVEQYLDLAGFHFGAETSQLMGFSARPLAGLSCAGFPIKVARLRMLREVMRWCSSFLYPLLPCLVWHSFQF